MDIVPALFVVMVVAMTVLILASIFSDAIVAAIRRRIPGFWYEGWMLMMLGLLVLMAFSAGLVVMYLALAP